MKEDDEDAVKDEDEGNWSRRKKEDIDEKKNGAAPEAVLGGKSWGTASLGVWGRAFSVGSFKFSRFCF